MKGSHFILPAVLAALALSACKTNEAEPPKTTATLPADGIDLSAKDEDGVPMLVEVLCAGCHATRPEQSSPLPNAPSFVSIANSERMTRETLATYLSDAHNYPDIMDVGLSDEDIEIIADYMITLKDAD